MSLAMRISAKQSTSILILSCLAIGCSPGIDRASGKRQAALEQLDLQSRAAPADALQQRIQTVLDSSLRNRLLSSDDNAAWQIMHGVICYGRQLQIDTPDRGKVSALDYLFSNGQLRGFELMRSADVLRSTGRNGIKARFEPGSYIGQGHVDQWLAICAMADIPLDTEIQVGDATLTLEDWARQAQFDVPNNPIDEYSWTLIALTHFFPDEPSWDAAGNVRVSWEELVQYELSYDIDLSPCGGTHRMAGIISALNAKRALGLPDSAVWQRAQDRVDALLQSAKENRGGDGRLSSFYFTRAGGTTDLSSELSSTGHMFEFIALAVPVAELDTPWVETSAQRLCELIEQTSSVDLDCGALYHALNGLKVYLQRRFQGQAV